MSDQCYFNGNFYKCITPTTPGESPVTSPAKWTLVQVPAKWRWLLTHLTYSGLLESDGQKDKAGDERNLALTSDQRGLDVLIRDQANREIFLERPSVRLRNFI